MPAVRASDQARIVAEAVNEIIRPKLNATVEFTMISFGDWSDRAIVALRAGEKIDIFFTPEWNGYMANITAGSLLALDDPNGPYGDLVNTYAPDTVRDLGDFIPANVVDGFLYAVATNKELCVPDGLMWNKTIADKYNINMDSIKTPEDLTPILEDFKTTEEYANGMYPLLNSGNDGAFSPFIQGFIQGMEPITMYNGEPGARDGVPVLTWDTPYQRERIQRVKGWYENGYMHPDSYLDTFTSDDYTNTGNFLVSTNYVLKGGQVKANELMGQSGNPDLVLYEVQTGPNFNYTTHAGGSMLGIPITSEDPVKAMLFINELHQNEELLNIMMWGIKGTHYDLDDRNMVIPREMNGWSDSHGGPWTLGNQFKQLLSHKEDPQKYEQMKDLTAKATSHESLGFRFRRAAFDAEFAAISNINRTYSRSMRCGVNTELFETFMSELHAAGLMRIYDDVLVQYAAWKAETYG